MFKRYYAAVALAVTVLMLFIAFYKVQPAVICRRIAGGRYIFVLPSMFFLSAYCYLRAVRWRLFFDRKIAYGRLFSATMIGFMANAVFPARAGEFVKAYVLGRLQRISKSKCLATVVLERLWDGFTLVLFIGVVLLWLGSSRETVLGRISGHIQINIIAAVFVLFYLAVFLILTAWKTRSERVVEFAKRLVSRFSARAADAVSVRLAKFAEGINIFQRPRRMFAIALFSFLIWISAALTIYAMLGIFSIALPLSAPFFLLLVLGFIVMVPSIGSLGTMQIGFIVGLAAYGIEKSDALSFSLLYQFLDTVPAVVVGLAFLWKEGLTFGKISKIKGEMNEKA